MAARAAVPHDTAGKTSARHHELRAAAAAGHFGDRSTCYCETILDRTSYWGAFHAAISVFFCVRGIEVP
jgi:hypothetical protein